MQDRRGNRPEDDEFDYEGKNIVDPDRNEMVDILWHERSHRLWLRAAIATQLKLYGLLISIATGLGILASTIASLWPGRVK